jgi:hypothetical protein
MKSIHSIIQNILILILQILRKLYHHIPRAVTLITETGKKLLSSKIVVLEYQIGCI